MNLALLAGLLVPWAIGTAFLAAAASGRDRPFGLARHGGYGFFLGAVLVCIAVRATAHFSSQLSFGMALAVLLAFGAVAVAAWWKRGWHWAWGGVGDTEPGRTGRVALVLLLVGIAFHGLLSALEIITLPLFPWDAWTVWAYRAKAWFLNGELFDFVNRVQWLRATEPGMYTQPALTYPLLPSIMPLWTAMSMGRWHEALINLPVIGCGLAIALGLYGQARLCAVRPAVSLLGVFLLLSTPIFATHMSLGGYADIWLAGFAGLGFIALMAGTLSNDRLQWLLGLAMLAAGTLVKAEGIVWLAAALAYVLLTALPPKKALALVFGLLAAGVLLAWWQPGTVNVPGLGRIGIEDGAVFVPLKGRISIVVNMVGDAYLQNIFMRDNWHLAWLALVLLAALSFAVDASARRATLTFLGLAGLMQLLIFGFTAQGAWAEDYTAINRLPLHVYPAVVFAGIVLVERLLGRHADRTAHGFQRGRVLGVLAGALVVTLAVLAAGLMTVSAEEGEPPEAIGLDRLEFVMGDGQRSPEGYRVEGYQDGVALLTSGPVQIDAGQYDLLGVVLAMRAEIEDPNRAPAFFWRRQDQEGSVSRLTLLGDDTLFDLARSEDWHGIITEVGFIVLEDAGPGFEIREVSLANSEPDSVLRLLPGEWFGYEPWTQRSAHSLSGGAERQHVPLLALVSAFVVVAAILTGLFGPRRWRFEVIMAVILAGWLVLDLRWSLNRVQRAERSVASLALPVETRLRGPELSRLDPWIARIHREFADAGAKRILIVSDPEEPKYYAWRSKYQLLPHSSMVYGPAPTPAPADLETVDMVMVIGDYLEPVPATVGLRERIEALPFDGSVLRRLELLDANPDGLLFGVKPERKR